MSHDMRVSRIIGVVVVAFALVATPSIDVRSEDPRSLVINILDEGDKIAAGDLVVTKWYPDPSDSTKPLQKQFEASLAFDRLDHSLRWDLETLGKKGARRIAYIEARHGIFYQQGESQFNNRLEPVHFEVSDSPLDMRVVGRSFVFDIDRRRDFQEVMSELKHGSFDYTPDARKQASTYAGSDNIVGVQCEYPPFYATNDTGGQSTCVTIVDFWIDRQRHIFVQMDVYAKCDGGDLYPNHQMVNEWSLINGVEVPTRVTHNNLNRSGIPTIQKEWRFKWISANSVAPARFDVNTFPSLNNPRTSIIVEQRPDGTWKPILTPSPPPDSFLKSHSVTALCTFVAIVLGNCVLFYVLLRKWKTR